MYFQIANSPDVLDKRSAIEHRGRTRCAPLPTRISEYLLTSLAISLLAACQTISPYDSTEYQQATATKATALTLMDKAADSFATHETEVNALELEIAKAYEYAHGRPKNELVTDQWDIIRNPKEGALYGFFAKWQKNGMLKATFVSQAKTQVSKEFDQLIGLESGKENPGG